MLASLRDLCTELRHGARRLARRPTFTLLGGVLCAAATGATLTLFAVVKSVLHDPLPMPRPDALVAVWCTIARFELSEYPYSWPNFADTRAALRSFDGLAATRGTSFTLQTAEEPILVEGSRVTRDLLRVLRARPALGADFGDDAPLASVLLGDELWRTRFGADPGIVGRAVVIDGKPHTVLGVLPAGLVLPGAGNELYIPFEPRGLEEHRANNVLRVFGRLRPGVALDAAAAELLAVSERLAEEYPDTNRELRARLVPLREQMVGGSRDSLRLLLGAVGVVFLVACGNVALLQIAAGVARRQETALRAALGAGTRGLLRLQVSEGLVLAVGAGAAGLGLAALAVRALRGVDPRLLPRAAELSVDPAAAAAALLAIVVATVLFSVAPALEALRAGGELRSRAFGTRGAERLQSAFVAAQVSLSVVLILVAATLSARYLALQRVDPGFRLERVVSATTKLSGPRHEIPGARLRTIEAAIEALAATPGVGAVGAISRLPFAPGNSSLVVRREGDPPDQPGPNSLFRWVSPTALDVLGIPVLRGRGLGPGDDADAPPVILIDESLAAALWPGESPLGRRLKLGGLDGWWEIVGTVPPVRVVGIDLEPEPMVWVSAAQNPFPDATLQPRFVVAASQDAAAMAEAVRSVLRRALPGLAVHQVQPLAAHLRTSLFDRRLVLHVTLAFSGTALLLAAIGTYSLVSFRVAQRRREWALRAALGAMPRKLLASALRSALEPVLVGIVAGAGLAAALAWRLRNDASGSPDAAGAVVTLSCLLLAATIASVFPAWRAARTDPARELRGD